MRGKGVIFDFDGTLAHTLPDIAAALNAGLRELGLPESSESDVRNWIGEGVPTLCRRALAAHPEVPAERLISVVAVHYEIHRLDQVRPFDGIAETLDVLVARRIPLAVLTNKPHVHTVPMVEALFARWPWVAVEGYKVEERRKPDPRNALEIAAKMSLSPAEVMMVGDSFTDIQTAVNAGMIPVGCTWGYRSRDELFAAGARHLLDRPQQLLELI